MKVYNINSASNNNSNPNFGHSFRVNICLKNETGLGDIFVSPRSNKELYQELTSKIVGWLNEDYLASLRNVFGKPKKVKKTEPLGDIHKKMVEELKRIDKDYARFGYTRSVNNGGRLRYILTGIDVSIAENLKGAKNIGISKADSKNYYGTTKTRYVRDLTKLVQENMRNYAQDNNVLLRSKDNKEIMLRAVFKITGKGKNNRPIYELDRFEFHENKTKPTLPEISPDFLSYKYDPSKDELIRKTIQNIIDKMSKK